MRTAIRVTASAMALALSACAVGHTRATWIPTRPLQGTREISINSPYGEVETALYAHLTKAGFRVKRFPREGSVTETKGTVAREKAVAAARYVVELDYRLSERCDEGGFVFARLRFDVIDTSINEIVLMATSEGRSEDCGDFSGTTFADFVKLLNSHWERQ